MSFDLSIAHYGDEKIFGGHFCFYDLFDETFVRNYLLENGPEAGALSATTMTREFVSRTDTW